MRVCGVPLFVDEPAAWLCGGKAWPLLPAREREHRSVLWPNAGDVI